MTFTVVDGSFQQMRERERRGRGTDAQSHLEGTRLHTAHDLSTNKLWWHKDQRTPNYHPILQKNTKNKESKDRTWTVHGQHGWVGHGQNMEQGMKRGWTERMNRHGQVRLSMDRAWTENDQATDKKRAESMDRTWPESMGRAQSLSELVRTTMTTSCQHVTSLISKPRELWGKYVSAHCFQEPQMCRIPACASIPESPRGAEAQKHQDRRGNAGSVPGNILSPTAPPDADPHTQISTPLMSSCPPLKYSCRPS